MHILPSILLLLFLPSLPIAQELGDEPDGLYAREVSHPPRIQMHIKRAEALASYLQDSLAGREADDEDYHFEGDDQALLFARMNDVGRAGKEIVQGFMDMISIAKNGCPAMGNPDHTICTRCKRWKEKGEMRRRDEDSLARRGKGGGGGGGTKAKTPAANGKALSEKDKKDRKDQCAGFV